MDDPQLICARLLREGAVERSALRGLEYPETRAEVERRLAGVGLVLATSAYSDHVGVRLSPEVTADAAFDAASNLNLKSDACALIVILWARLVLQKRTAVDTRDVPGQAELMPDAAAQKAETFKPQLRLATLLREFGPVLGSKQHILALVSQLRRLRFIAGHGEVIEAGPLLELGVDGEKMIAFIKRRVLAELLGQKPEPGEAQPPTAEEHLQQVIGELGGSASIGDLEAKTSERRSRLKQLLAALESRGRVYRVGQRSQTRYHLKAT